jgi:hypothetical protein
MAYWNTTTGNVSSQLDNFGYGSGGSQPKLTEFYEFEPAVVLDIILDKDHPSFSDNPIDYARWQADLNGRAPKPTDLDYTWIGRVLVRMAYTHRNVEKEELVWAIPLESNVSEYPLINEAVAIVRYFDKYYYTRKINVFNTPNNNVDFNLEVSLGGFKDNGGAKISGNRELIQDPTNPIYEDYSGPVSKTKLTGGFGYEGVMGRYFYTNERIRALKRREGDTIVESRFGSSIRFAAYDDNRDIDNGTSPIWTKGYTDYARSGVYNPWTMGAAGCGNPMVLIRNRQRPLKEGIPEEKNVGGYIIEDINNDGSSIHLTSGATLSGFLPTCVKKMWGNGEEQSAFFPAGSTKFVYPKLVGDQIVINTDRLILSSKAAETFHYSKKRYAVVTDDEYTVDAHNQIILTTNQKTVINSPAIYLGEYDVTGEPALLGQTTVNWLYDLCEWLKSHTHYFKHGHAHHYSNNVEETTQIPKPQAQLVALQQQLNLLLSRRVFMTGGGFAKGKNGEAINVRGGVPPVKISIPSGNGVPGGFNGQNKRT